jgi:hypothetical protein
MEAVMADIAERSVHYYFAKYREQHFADVEAGAGSEPSPDSAR